MCYRIPVQLKLYSSKYHTCSSFCEENKSNMSLKKGMTWSIDNYQIIQYDDSNRTLKKVNAGYLEYKINAIETTNANDMYVVLFIVSYSFDYNGTNQLMSEKLLSIYNTKDNSFIGFEPMEESYKVEDSNEIVYKNNVVYKKQVLLENGMLQILFSPMDNSYFVYAVDLPRKV